MNFIKIIILGIILFFSSQTVFAENHIDEEEPLPLNDPFAGDASTGGKRTGLILAGSEDEKDEMSLYNFKLVGVVKGKFDGYASLINSEGELITLQLNEELSEGVSLVELRKNDVVFQNGEDSYLIINFKNQIKETSGAVSYTHLTLPTIYSV